MGFALGDAAWLTGLERNCDVIMMNCYAPLLVNVNPGGRQWQVNLIGYNGLGSFGSPAYFVQKMFSSNRGDTILAANFENLPQLTPDKIPQAPNAPPRPAGTAPTTGPGARRGPQSFDALYATASKDSASGDISGSLRRPSLKSLSSM